MNLFKLSWKNLIARPLSMSLSVILVALGISLTTLLLLLNAQFEDRLTRNAEGINLVVSAKGSPLQMVLSGVYHIGGPTGKIPLKKTKWLKKSMYVEKAMPITLGDNYEGFKIVGTEHSLPEHFGMELAEGRLWETEMEVTLGHEVAQKTKLKIGDTFYGAHGLIDDGMHVHDNFAYKVVGILKPIETVHDNLIFTDIASTWRVHAEHDHDHEEDGHEGHNHDEHDHGHDHDHGDGHDHNHEEEDAHNHDEHDHDHAPADTTAIKEEKHDHDDHDHGHDHDHHDHGKELPPIPEEDQDVTAVLVSYKKDNNGNTSGMAIAMVPKLIDETEGFEELGYAVPATEYQKIVDNFSIGAQFLYVLILIIVIISAFSMFISLFNSMKQRKYEVALMRSMGASRMVLFFMVTLEGLFIAIFGFLLGMLISHGGMEIFSGYLEESYKYSFSGFLFLTEEIYLFIGTLVIGLLASVIPAIQAYGTDISGTLSRG